MRLFFALSLLIFFQQTACGYDFSFDPHKPELNIEFKFNEKQKQGEPVNRDVFVALGSTCKASKDFLVQHGQPILVLIACGILVVFVTKS